MIYKNKKYKEEEEELNYTNRRKLP